MPISPLPYLDEHAITIAAGAGDVWPVLLAVLDRTFAGARAAAYARAVGCVPDAAAGPRPLAEGSAVPGFRVVGSSPPVELALEGRHRFSAYALTFRLEPLAEALSRLRAESRAAFPGLSGGLYRLAVVGSGAHGVSVRRLLAGVEAAVRRG